MRRKTKKMARMILLAAMMAAMMLICAGCGGSGGDENASVQDFSGQTADGSTWTAADLQAHDVTMINVWGTFCAPCVEEMPELAEMQKQMPDNVEVILYCSDYADNTAKDCEEILAQADYTGTNLVKVEGDLQTLLGGTSVYPTTYFLDSEGNQIAGPIAGVPKGAAADYLAKINTGLEALGKDPIELK